MTSPEPAPRPLRLVPEPRRPDAGPGAASPAGTGRSLIPGQGAPDDPLRRPVPVAGRPPVPPVPPPDRRPASHRHDLDHRRAPLATAVERYRQASTVLFSGPSHRGGRAADPVLRGLVGADMLSADVRLEPAELHRVRREAEDLAASLWGAERAFFLGNGSSSGNQAFLLATLRPGDEVVVARDAHLSTLTAIVLTGAKPVWVSPDVHDRTGLGLRLRPEVLAATLAAHPAARLVALVSPTYAGVCSDLPALVDVAHAADVPVFVDETRGPHLPFHRWLPTDALAAGADAVVTSTDKLAGSLSQSALLLVRDERLDPESVATAVETMSTTHPLLPLLASIDTARRRLALDGQAVVDRALARAGWLRERLAGMVGVEVVDAGRLGVEPASLDPLTVVVDVTGLGRTGVDVDRLLRERHGVTVEGGDLRHVYLQVSPADHDAAVDRLAAGLADLRRQRPDGAEPVLTPPGATTVLTPRERVVSPRVAWFAPSERVALHAAAGRVAAEPATPYPPGVPVLVPGEVIDEAQIEFLESVLAAGGHVHGTADPALTTLRVMAAR